jgi:Uma2 family endonuclease
MTTKLKIGPEDHGRRFTAEEIRSADYAEGHKYEIIDGRLYVSPVPNAPAGWVENWILDLLKAYQRAHPEVINYVHPKARVFVPNRPEETAPEPDVAAYPDYPRHLPPAEQDWRNTSPILVVEVMSEQEGQEKDLQRNPDLYRQVRSIREYWALDARASTAEPTLIVYRRQGRRWERLADVPGGGTYTTPLLPGFTLTLTTTD